MSETSRRRPASWGCKSFLSRPAAKAKSMPLLLDRRKSGIDFAFAAGLDKNDLQPHDAGRRRDVSDIGFGRWVCRVHQMSDDRGGGHHLVQQPQTLRLQLGG